MNNTNWLANIFDWIGEVFERLSPAMFRMLSTVAPYFTPIPVAWLTAHSASVFLGFPTNVSVIFVVMLEALGLWSTTLLVDAFVEAIRSRNLKGWGVVIFLAAVCIAYVSILIKLNVTLEQAVGNNNPVLSQVITLICFLPFIAGCLNGYRKVKMDTKTQMQIDRERQDALDEKIRHENNELKLQKAALKHGFNPFAPQVPMQTLAVDTEKVEVKEPKEKHPSQYEEKALKFLDDVHEKEGRVLRVVELTSKYGFEYDKAKGYFSTLRKNWANDRHIQLN